MTLRRPLLAALAVFLAAVPAARAQDATPVASLERPSEVRHRDGTLLWSAWDTAAGAYRLRLRDAAGAERDVGVPPSAGPYDADLGTGARGGLVVVVALRGDLHVVPVGASGPGTPRPAATANTRRTEMRPTIDRGRLAWARIEAGRPAVYTKLLSAPRSRRALRLPGVPVRNCDVLVERGSCATRGRAVAQLELLEGRLAQSVTYVVPRGVGHRQNEVREVILRRRSSRRLASMTTGESGQEYLGLSYAGSRLSWYRGCALACEGSFTAFFRYREGVGYDVADAPGGLAGYAGTGDGTWQVRGAQDGSCDAPCRLVRTREPRWRRIAASRVR